MALTLTCKKILRLSVSSRYFFKHLSTTSPEKKGLVLGVYSDEKGENLELTPAAEQYNQTSQGRLLENLKLIGKVKAGKSVQFWGLDQEFASIAVVGLGKKSQPYDELEQIHPEKESIRTAAAVGCKALDAAGITSIHVEPFNQTESAAEAATLSTWKFQQYKTQPAPIPTVSLFSQDPAAQAQWRRGQIKAEAQNVARRLADTPSNLLTPTIFAEEAQHIFKNLNVTVEVRDEGWAKKEKMGALLSVARGSVEPLRFVELSLKNSDDTNPAVLVGKGVTFDAGGISLKPAGQMDEMRADMSGAACVVGATLGLAQLNAKVNLKVLVPLVENMPSGSATKPGDVVWARNGKSICVDNTDAEGRLILADALSYSEVFKPKWVLDIATLTGAIRVALGSPASGVFTNSNKLYNILQEAGANAGDRVWRMPLWKHYTKLLTKNNAYDINNIGKGGKGGSCTAAAFLKEFIPENTDWLHLDIAGVMGPDDDCPYLTKGMTGRPTRTLIEFIEAQTQN